MFAYINGDICIPILTFFKPDFGIVFYVQVRTSCCVLSLALLFSFIRGKEGGCTAFCVLKGRKCLNAWEKAERKEEAAGNSPCSQNKFNWTFERRKEKLLINVSLFFLLFSVSSVVGCDSFLLSKVKVSLKAISALHNSRLTDLTD